MLGGGRIAMCFIEESVSGGGYVIRVFGLKFGLLPVKGDDRMFLVEHKKISE